MKLSRRLKDEIVVTCEEEKMKREKMKREKIKRGDEERRR